MSYGDQISNGLGAYRNIHWQETLMRIATWKAIMGMHEIIAVFNCFLRSATQCWFVPLASHVVLYVCLYWVVVHSVCPLLFVILATIECSSLVSPSKLLIYRGYEQLSFTFSLQFTNKLAQLMVSHLITILYKTHIDSGSNWHVTYDQAELWVLTI